MDECISVIWIFGVIYNSKKQVQVILNFPIGFVLTD